VTDVFGAATRGGGYSAAMDEQNRRALLGIALLAARADGARDEREKEAVHAALGRMRAEGLDPEALWNEVESGRRGLAQSARELTSPEARALGYELAVCVCDADGATNEEERAFLGELARALGLSGAVTERFRREADALADAPLAAGAAGAAQAEELDQLILRQAILCGGLELLPQRLATLAILPLQMRLVFQIGKRHGYELDRGHVKDFLGVAGVGMASQMIEGFARQLVGGLLGRVAGGLLGGLGRGATGAGFSFATTYALGHAAKRYYASGRKLSGAELKQLFGELLGRARELEPRHAAEIAASARGADLGALRRLLSV
jgi:tellurite resistance protein/uncharacterized protein (DUF697 family)